MVSWRFSSLPRLSHVGLVLLLAAACSGSKDSNFGLADGGSDGARRDGGGVGAGKDTGPIMLHSPDTGTIDTGTVVSYTDPSTCAEAATSKSYVGCDYWPTVTANVVWEGFDFTAVVANTQTVTANITVTGANGYSQAATVAPGGLTKIYLPWVDALKGSATTGFTSSITVPGGAYHLVSSVPVTVYQFNALEYKGVGGAPGKSWKGCPDSDGMGCYSYTNDASVLIPSTAMTGNYRITGEHGSSMEMDGPIAAITATQDGTSVTVTLSGTANVIASKAGDIPTTAGGGTVSFGLNAGDVVELLGGLDDSADLSGSLVYATHPVQVIAARQCANQPDPMAACDHLESSVLPAETWGKDYVVTVPTSPNAKVIGHVVRFFGNVDGTTLTYSPSQPAGCPSTLQAGEVVECTGTADCATGMSNVDQKKPPPVQVSCVTTTFEVTGTNEFAVSSFMLGGSAVDPGASDDASEGDPSMSPMVATEQYRVKYIFLAPTDYDESYADVVVPVGGTLTLDGAPVTATPTSVNASWSVLRLPLQAGQDGAHVMTGTLPFGVQVIGYGAYTSYQYPAGLDLAEIAPPPPPPPNIVK